MNLLDHKLKALDFWRDNGHTSPICKTCENPIPWGGGFILEDSKFVCNPCIEKNCLDVLTKII